MSIDMERRALLRRLLPYDRPDDLAVHQGQFHIVVVGSDRVVCFPRTPAAAARLPERASSLNALIGVDLGFHTPEPLLQGGAHGTDEIPFLVLSRIPGELLAADALDDARVIAAVAAQYSALLTALARAGADETVRAAFPHAPENHWRRFAASVRAELFSLMSPNGRRRAERELTAVDDLPHLTRAVVHGDLGAENVLWEWTDGLPHLSGVLDWDDVTLGDPAEDLAAIGSSYSGGLLERILTLGNWPTEGLSTRIEAIRGTFALQQALSASRDGDAEELAEGLAGYR